MEGLTINLAQLVVKALKGVIDQAVIQATELQCIEIGYRADSLCLVFRDNSTLVVKVAAEGWSAA